MLEYVLILVLFAGLIVWRFFASDPKNVGKAGEKRVSRKLDWLPREYIVLNDVMLPTQYGTTQIDHIVVSPYGVFVIETKNYKGWIFGHENSEEWKQSLLGKKTLYGWSSEQHKFRNPIRQNQTHARAVKRILADLGDFPIVPIVVFSDNAELKITTPNHIVINWCLLRKVIKQFDVKCISGLSVKKIVSSLKTANIVNEEMKETHVSSVRRIKERKSQMIENRICPQCHSPLVERQGRYGHFLGCSNYPKCNFTHNI